MRTERIYPGIDEDVYGGLSDIGLIIRDAWVFGLIPETEKCVGWDYGRIETLYDKVHTEWAQYGHLASRLPSALRERHRRIYDAALDCARAAGWTAELDDEE